MRDFKKMKIWIASITLVKDVYNLTKSYPKDEVYTLTKETRRSAISVPSNIAEGSGKRSEKAFANYLYHAYASSCELYTQLLIGHDQDYFDDDTLNDYDDRIDHLQRMIWRYINKLDA